MANKPDNGHCYDLDVSYHKKLSHILNEDKARGFGLRSCKHDSGPVIQYLLDEGYGV